MSNPVLSLCMPTNGVSEWVFPVLDSVYSQGCKNADFEVILLYLSILTIHRCPFLLNKSAPCCIYLQSKEQ